MNTVRLAVSVRRHGDYDPLALCSFIENWAASAGGPVKVSMEKRQLREESPSADGAASELLFLKVDYDNYPTPGNYLIEINQSVTTAVRHFDGVECTGIHAA